MSLTGRVKHVIVFVAAIVLVWFSGVLPVLVLKPAPYANSSPMDVIASMGAPTLEGILRGWPIYFAVAIIQALTFHFVKRFSTPVFLTIVFALGSLMAWRYWTTYV